MSKEIIRGLSMNAMDANDLLAENPAAGLGGLTGHTFRKWRQLGLGPAYIKISARCIRYRRGDVLAWLEARRVQPVRGNVEAREPAAAR